MLLYPFFGIVVGDKLAKELIGDEVVDLDSSSSSFLIGQVDCKKQSKLCRQHDIVNFPSIKYGFLETTTAGGGDDDASSSPSNLIEYQGSHDYDDLKEFVQLLLQQPCATTVAEINTTGTNCSNEQRDFLNKIQDNETVSLNDVELMIEQEENNIKQIYQDFESSVDGKFQEQYNRLLKQRDDDLISIRQDIDILKSMISVKEKDHENLGGSSLDEL